MQTHIVIHRGFDKSGLVCCAVEVAGRLVGFTSTVCAADWSARSATEWARIPFTCDASLQKWKRRARRDYHAHRFERVTVLGETQ